MKKTVVMTLAGMVALSATLGAFAQTTNVYSRNAVGYVNMGISNAFTLMCIPLDKAGNTPLTIDDVFPSMLDNTIIYVFNPATSRYREFTFYTGYGWYEGEDPAGTNALPRGLGFWLRVGQSTNISVVGEVPSTTGSATTTVSIAPGFNIISYPFPVARKLSETEIGQHATDNDVIYVWDGAQYLEYTFYNGYGWYKGEDPADPILQPGLGFWYSNRGTLRSANEPKPYQWP